MWALNKTWLITALIALVFCFLSQASAFNVDLFEHKHFKGRSSKLDVRGCTNIPYEFDDTVSSVNPDQCVVIFKHPNCQGPRVRVEPYGFGTAYLREINFEDKLSSLAPCNFQSQPPTRDEY